MSRSTNALLLSALVMPGAGQLYLKHVLRGMVLIAVSLVCLWLIGESMWQQAAVVLDQLRSSEASLDTSHIAELAAQTPGGSSGSTATFVLIGCWLGGLIDTYWLCKKPGAN